MNDAIERAETIIISVLNWAITQYNKIPPRIRILGGTMFAVVVGIIVTLLGITILFYILAAILGGTIRLIWNYPISLLILPALIAGIMAMRDSPAQNPQTTASSAGSVGVVNEDDNDIF